MRVSKIDLTPQTFVRAVVTVASVWLLVQLWPVLLVMCAGLMLVGSLNPFVAQLERRGMGRKVAIALVFVFLFLGGAATAALLVPSLVAQAGTMVDSLAQPQERLAGLLDGWRFGSPLARSIRETKVNDVLAGAMRSGFDYGPKVFVAAAYAVTAFFFALYVMLDRDRLRGGAFALLPRGHHVRVSRILINLGNIVGGYLRGQLLTSLMMALFTLVVLTIAGVPHALPLALFAGIVDVLPYVGGILVCGPAWLAALSRGSSVALVVLGALVVYQEFESRFLVPKIYGKILRLPSAVVVIALLVGSTLLGIVGALLALPFAAGLRMIVEELRLELPGESNLDDEVRARDEAEEREFERRADGAPAIEAAAIASSIAEARLEYDSAHPPEGE